MPLVYNTKKTGVFSIWNFVRLACRTINVFRAQIEHQIDISDALTDTQKAAAKAGLDTILALCTLYELLYKGQDT